MNNDGLTMLYEVTRGLNEEQFDFFLFYLKACIKNPLEISAEGVEKKYLEYLAQKAVK